MGASKRAMLEQMESRPSVSCESAPVAEMVTWFCDRFVNPAEWLPINDSYYIWLEGGPYHPDEQLTERYANTVSREDLDRAISILNDHGGYDWAMSQDAWAVEQDKQKLKECDELLDGLNGHD